ncbi:MAG TPA: 3-deoxy-7-phosphoheptulonate synthase [Clostridiales bacterium]|nr:3-deoxy-7-phosphoheptulonate synthase [Clostridia bacterium]HCS74112.1 3-deoxy-7-phosphoheptulonate synthase [Clostridiales bacterium]
MIIIMKTNAAKEDIANVEKRLLDLGFQTHPIYGEIKTVIGAIGDKSRADPSSLINLPGVESIVPIMKPYKLVGKELKKEPTVVEVGEGVRFGAKELVVIAGPCAIEGEEQIYNVAEAVKKAGAKVLRGGAFKPRTSPYSFQGLEEEGLKLLYRVRQDLNMPVITEVVDTRDVELVSRYSDVLQIGARNMQNFRLLSECGKTRKPVMLKRGLSSTIEEWLMAAEYVMSEGDSKVILCERGIRTFETATRNTMDINAIPVVKELSHLPIIADPSHGTGNWKYVNAVSRAFVAAGADGLIVEVHPDPEHAASDGPQSLKPGVFNELMQVLKPIAEAVDRSL